MAPAARFHQPRWLLLAGALLLLASPQPAAGAGDDASVGLPELTDDSLGSVLEEYQIVVLAACWSEESCTELGTQLSKAASILGRVAFAGSSIALGSVALHDTAATAETGATYRLADDASQGEPRESSADEPRCITRVVVGGVEVDAGLTDDDGKPALVSTLARSLVRFIMRQIIPGAKALAENADLITILTSANFDKTVAKAKKDGQQLLINFYQPPVCLHWPYEYATAASKQHKMSKKPVLFAKLDVRREADLASKLGVGQPAHDFWHLYRDGKKVAEHTGERTEGAMLKFIASNSKARLTTVAAGRLHESMDKEAHDLKDDVFGVEADARKKKVDTAKSRLTPKLRANLEQEEAMKQWKEENEFKNRFNTQMEQQKKDGVDKDREL